MTDVRGACGVLIGECGGTKYVCGSFDMSIETKGFNLEVVELIKHDILKWLGHI